MTTKRNPFESFRADVLEGKTIEVGGIEYPIATLASHARLELNYGPDFDDGPGFEASTRALRRWFDGSGLPLYVYLDTDSGEIATDNPCDLRVNCEDCDGGETDDGETCDRCDGKGSLPAYFEPGQIEEHSTVKALFGRDLEGYLR